MTRRQLSDLIWTPVAKVTVAVWIFVLEHQPQSKSG